MKRTLPSIAAIGSIVALVAVPAFADTFQPKESMFAPPDVSWNSVVTGEIQGPATATYNITDFTFDLSGLLDQQFGTVDTATLMAPDAQDVEMKSVLQASWVQEGPAGSFEQIGTVDTATLMVPGIYEQRGAHGMTMTADQLSSGSLGASAPFVGSQLGVRHGNTNATTRLGGGPQPMQNRNKSFLNKILPSEKKLWRLGFFD